MSLEQVEQTVAAAGDADAEMDRQREFGRLFALIHELKPLDRQILLSYLEDLDAASIADITGLSAANVAMKIHRIKAILARRFREQEQQPHEA